MSFKVCVIGSNGFLGRKIVEKFKLNKYYISGFSREDANNLDKHYFFNHPQKPIDYNLLLEHDIIIYAVGAGVQSNSKETVNDIYYLNAFLPIEIILFLENNKWDGKFITFGSYFEIGYNNEKKFYSEEDVVLSPNKVPNEYCTSKRILARFLNSRNINIKYFHLILPNIYGKGENENRLLPYLIDSIINGNKLKLTSGDQLRQYIHVDDIVKYIDIILNENITSGYYNITNEDPLTVKEIVYLVHNLLGKQCSEEIFGTNERNDASMNVLLLSSKKASSEFKYSNKISIKEGILSYL